MAKPAWPNRPVTVMVPIAPSGATDVITRLPSQALSARPGQQFILGNLASTGFGLFAPAGMPRPVSAKSSEEARPITLSPATKTRLEPLAIELAGGTPKQFGPSAASEQSDLIQYRNIRLE